MYFMLFCFYLQLVAGITAVTMNNLLVML